RAATLEAAITWHGGEAEASKRAFAALSASQRQSVMRFLHSSMSTFFISDLHIHESVPEIAAQFLQFLHDEAAQADALYILGDLFEAWIGDDDPNEHFRAVQDALAQYSQSVPCYFMHGNRDFLIGDAFAKRTGCTLLRDPVVHQFHGENVLLSHGDLYCTDDEEYQAVRRTVRDPAWQAQVLSLPVPARMQLAGNARNESAASNAQKTEEIMDVNEDAIIATLEAHAVHTLLHGHTHRPAQHDITLSDGSHARRLVLGDWYSQGSVGIWDEHGYQLKTLPR
ncbi:MAG: UDP-2,3-diacylglucosamine diphosphatase, partial [Pseudomonadota bacterium]